MEPVVTQKQPETCHRWLDGTFRRRTTETSTQNPHSEHSECRRLKAFSAAPLAEPPTAPFLPDRPLRRRHEIGILRVLRVEVFTGAGHWSGMNLEKGTEMGSVIVTICSPNNQLQNA